MLPTLAFDRIPVTIKNLETKEARIRIAAGSMNTGISEISIRAPIEMKNRAPNMSLRGIVAILATDALLGSATSTPARKAPVATDRPNLEPHKTIQRQALELLVITEYND